MSSKPKPIIFIFERITNGQLCRGIILVLMMTVILIFLLLPPVSLADRLLNIGYHRVGPGNGVISDSNGEQIIVLLTGLKRSLWVKLEVVSGAMLTADDTLFTAGKNIPPDLKISGPVYHIQHRGDSPAAAKLIISIPAGVGPLHTLDLYTWNGEIWAWLPNRKISAGNVIEAELDFLPETVAIVQSGNVGEFGQRQPATFLPGLFTEMGLELNPQEFLLNNNGSLIATPVKIPPEIKESAVTIIPTIRNWNDPQPILSNSVNNLLRNPEAQQRHIKAIVEIVQRNTYQGINLDYRGIDPGLRQEYTGFLTQLRRALPDNTYLSVQVDMPRPLSAGEDISSPYDWQAIGQTVDFVKVPTSPDPSAFAPGGEMETMLDWAVGQVNRSKLQLLFRVHSVEQINGITYDLNYQRAWAQAGEVKLVNDSDTFNPDQKIEFTLSAPSTSTGVQIDDATGTYWYAYVDEKNRHHTVYLENAAGITDASRLVAKYNLHGLVFQNLPDSTNGDRPWEVIQRLLTSNDPLLESQYTLVWLVQRQDGRVMAEKALDLTNPNFVWIAPETGGVYDVAASIFSNQKAGMAIPRGSVRVLVTTPTPGPASTP